MIRTLFLLLAWFVAVPSFSQGKPASPSTQEQLLELRLEQQHLKEKLDDQKASLEEKFEVKKENLSNQKGIVEWWLSALGVLVTFVGVVLPIVGFIYGKKAYADIKKQKDDIQKEQKGLKDWIDKKQEQVEQMHKKQSEWMRLQRISASLTSNKLKKIVVQKRKELDIMLAEADSVLGRIKERDTNCRRYEENLKTASERVTIITANTDSSINGEVNNKFDFSKQAKEIEQSNDATPFQKAMAKALEFYFADKYEESIKQHLLILDEYKSELTLEQLPAFYFRLAFSYGKLKNDDKAIEFYRKVLGLDSMEYAALYNLGISYKEKEMYLDANKCFMQVVDLNNEFVPAWLELGNVFILNKKYDDALSSYEMAIKYEPNNEKAWSNRGIASTLNLNYTDAVTFFKKALSINNTSESWYNLGIVYRKMEDFVKALDSFNESTRINPDYVDAWVNMAYTYSRLGDYSNAIKMYNEAVRLKPDHSLALTNLAELLIIQNEDVVETLSKLRAAVKMEGNGFDHLLLETIRKVKSKTYTVTRDNAFEQLKQTVNDDANKVAWDFKILKEWLASEEATPKALDKEAWEFITELIQRIEEWRGSQPKAE